MNYKVTTEPSAEPITRDEAKLHLRVDGTAEDTLIDGLIVAARQMVEQYLNRVLITQTIVQKHSSFSGGIRIYRHPIQSLSSIVYKNVSNETTTLSTEVYRLVANGEPAYILPDHGKTFPTTTGEAENIEITYVAGYGEASAVPQTIKQAMLLIIGDLYENRQDAKRTMPQASQCLLNDWRITLF